MNKTIRLVKFYVKRYLFEKFAIPKVRYESISKAILKRYLPLNPVIVDCGAHDGSDTIALAKLSKQATVHAFEAMPDLYKKLVVNTQQYDNIKCYQLALADQTGKMNFYISEGASDASSSLLEPKEHLNDHPSTFFNSKIVVKAETLDDWARTYNITRVDMLWLDMQGFELNMLKASNEILKLVSVIHTEVSTKETYKNVGQYTEYRSFLEDKGFEVSIEAIPQGWDMGNVLFVRKK